MNLRPSVLAEDDASREAIAEALAPLTLDTLDLQAGAYMAHWSVRGPYTAPLHDLFGKLAASLAGHADALNEHLRLIGAMPVGTPQQVADGSRLDPYPVDVVDGLAHCEALTERGRAFLFSVEEAITACNDAGSADALDLVTQVKRDTAKTLGFIADHLVTDSAPSAKR